MADIAATNPAAGGWAVKRQADTLDLEALPEETAAVRLEARQFADGVLRPIAHDLNTLPERRDGFRHDVFAALANAGLIGIPFAHDVGGRGLQFPVLASMTVIEELAYHSPGIASSMFDAHALLVGTVLDGAAPHLRERYLPKIIRGEMVGCFATSEPGTSTDLSPRALRTTATPIADGWRIDGCKRWITNAPVGDIVIALCRTGEGLSLVLIDMHAAGVTVLDPDLKMGNRAQLTADILFDGVEIPADHMIGSPGAGLRGALGALTLGRIGIAAVGVAMAQRAFDIAIAYTSYRHAYGKPIAANQYWQYRFAEHAIEIEAARGFWRKAARLADSGGDSSGIFASMAKIKGSSIAVDVARDAVQACGGYGFAQFIAGPQERWPLEAIYRDAKVGEIYEGANEVQKWVIARNIFGRDITG